LRVGKVFKNYITKEGAQREPPLEPTIRDQTTPNAIMASATFLKPAIFDPAI
jgi:hypothetical protein